MLFVYVVFIQLFVWFGMLLAGESEGTICFFNCMQI